MKPPKFAQFGYQHGTKLAPFWLKLALALFLLCAPMMLYYWRAFSAPVIIGGVVFFAMIWPKERLCISPRYLVCGKTVLYFRNVQALEIHGSDGRLKLTALNGEQIVLERDKFPTNARKKDKIAANKQAKFSKVAKKILDKVKAHAPTAQVKGEQSLGVQKNAG